VPGQFRRLRSIRFRLGLAFAALVALAGINIGVFSAAARQREGVFLQLEEAIARHRILSEARARVDDEHRRVKVLSEVVGIEASALSDEERAATLLAVAAIPEALSLLAGHIDANSGIPRLRARADSLSRSWSRFYSLQAPEPERAVAELVMTADPLARELLSGDFPAVMAAESERVDRARATFVRTDRRIWRSIWTVLALSGVLVAGVALSISRDLLRAIGALTGAAARYGSGDLSHRVAVRNCEELEGVASGLNDMAGRLDRTRRELEQRNQELADLAFRDPLTHLANRSLFRRNVEHALAGRDRDPEEVAVLFLDLDNFKSINDTLGHDAGDRLLLEVARRLVSVAHGSATVARLGGDEFALLLVPVAAASEAAIVAEHLVAAMRAPFAVLDRAVHVSASVGIAFGRSGEGADALLRDADVAMYRAKAAGKGRYEVFAPEMHAELLDRMELEVELRRALAAEELELFYQPVVRLDTGAVTAFEALVRWRHPRRGLMPPSAFIPLAEESGAIVPLGRWVLTRACAEAARWQRRGRPIDVAVNVSGAQLADDRFADDVAAALEGAGIDPQRLVLEITESVIMRDGLETRRRLKALKERGVRLAIDDFGTGYSSLASLQRFPVDILKIDKAFIDSVARGANDRALARTIIGLAEILRLETVAEGIEDAEQLAQLRALACPLGQGYLFSPPLPADQANAYLEASLAGGLAVVVG
jgi:diguanylate cyclase (GGDEF)-like protein